VSQNIVYGDVKGNIGLHACAGVPIRKRDAIYKVLPGSTDEYDWKGMVPYEELPFEYNPGRGFVSSANNRTTDSLYPYHIGVWYDIPFRIDRIREMLNSKDKFSIDDFKTMQNDSKSKYAELVIEKCYKLLDTNIMSLKENEVFRLLKNWDGNMDKNMIQPTVTEAFFSSLTKRIFQDELGPELYELFKSNKIGRIALYNVFETDNSPWIDNIATTENESFGQIVQSAYSDAVSGLMENYSGNLNKWKWEKIHSITFSHPLSKVKIIGILFHLNRGPFGVNGSFHTVAPYSYPMDNPSKVEHGASHRHIYSLADWDATQSVIPTGNSGVIKSKFYLDQTKMFIDGKYHNDLFSDEAVKNNAKYIMHLKPYR
jgi:penicillin amidase